MIRRRHKKLINFTIILSLFFISLFSYNVYKNRSIESGTDDISLLDSNPKEDSGIEFVDLNYYTFEREYDIKIESSAENSKSITEQYYTVKRGDSLYKISRKIGQDINILVANNPKIKNGVIKIGQKLKILSKDGIYYKVKKGDNLIKISDKYKVDLNKVVKANNLSDTQLGIGQKLFIPNPNLNALLKANKKRNTYSDALDFRWPIKWRGITSKFGKRLHPIKKRYILHKGVDLRAKVGVPIYAPEDGKVSYANWMGAYGKLIEIKHKNRYSTRFAHLSKIYVKNGQRVKKGDLLGKTGVTGGITGPHLHYEIRRRNKPLDPVKFR